MQQANEVLKQYFGYDSFKEGQQEVIETILSGRDAMAIMPTGAGKSAFLTGATSANTVRGQATSYALSNLFDFHYIPPKIPAKKAVSTETAFTNTNFPN